MRAVSGGHTKTISYTFFDITLFWNTSISAYTIWIYQYPNIHQYDILILKYNIISVYPTFQHTIFWHTLISSITFFQHTKYLNITVFQNMLAFIKPISTWPNLTILMSRYFPSPCGEQQSDRSMLAFVVEIQVRLG